MNKRLCKAFALLLIFAMMIVPFGMVSAAAYSDISGHWAESVIEKWSGAGIINGYSDGSFHPDDNITRAELAKIISSPAELGGAAAAEFNDVTEADWYYADVMKCAAEGVINGYEDGSFRPENYVTREEAAVMFSRGFNITKQSEMTFADSADISDWAADAVMAMASQGIINGYEDGTFRPSANITRAETVKILDGAVSSENDAVRTASPGVTGGTPVTGTGNIYSGGGSGVGPGYGVGSGGGGSQSSMITVTFDACGGKFADGNGRYSVKIPAGSVISGNIPIPVLEGRIFDGWYKTKSAADNLNESQAFDINSTVRTSLTVYAGWHSEGKSTVTFNTNNGTPAIEAAEVENGGYALAPDTVPMRAHYTFKGWFSDAAAANAFDFAKTVIKKDTTIYAGWTIDPKYADKEITIPSKTNNYIPGDIIAAPTTVLPGENTCITFVPPQNHTLKDNSSIVVKYTVIDLNGAEIEQTQVLAALNSSVNFVMPENVKNGSIKIQAEFTIQVGPTASPKPTKDPNATPEPTPAPTKAPLVIGEQTIQWTATTADDNRKKGDMVMPGLSLMFDVTSKGNAKVTIDGRNFERYISSGENGSWGGAEASGTALKYEAAEDGEFTVYVNKLGQEKSLYITRSGSSNKEEKDGENVKKLNDTEGDINLSLSIIVEKGHTYYAYVSGSKGRFVGAGFAPAIEGDPNATRPPIPTPVPTAEPIETEEIDMTAIDRGTSISKSADGYTEIRKRANGEIIYCPTIGEEPEIELPIAVGYGDKESYYVFRNETDAARYKYTANIPDLLARTPNKTDSEDTMVGVLRVKSPCDGTLKLIYARNGSDSAPGYSLYAYNGINGTQQMVSTLQNGGLYYETKAIAVKAGDVIYFDSDWEKGIKYSMAIFTPTGGSVEPPATSQPTEPTAQPTEPTTQPAEPTVAPTLQPDDPVQPPVTGDEIMWTFGDGSDKIIDLGTLDFDGGLSYITTDSKSSFASGGKVDGVEFPGRIKLGGKSTFDEGKYARVFVFMPSASGTVTVYFTHGSSKDANPRHVLVYQNGVEVAKLPVETTGSVAGSCEVTAGAPVYIGGDNNIGVFGIKFTAAN